MSTQTTARQHLSADFGKVMDDIDSLVNATSNRAEGEAKALRERILERLDAAKEKVADVQYETVAKAKDAAHATDNYVHEHPWQAIGAAAAVGLALGVLIGRR
jgi:ElaB/YqjD/DUF883 family membrane-anchored ribosome-binding protein